MATRKKNRWLRTRIEKEVFPFCMCCTFKAKLLYHYCKVSDQYGLWTTVFSGSTRPFLYACGPWQCFLFSNSTSCPPVKAVVLGLNLPVLWQGYSWGEHLPFPSEWGFAHDFLCRGKPLVEQEHPHHKSSLGRCMKPEIILTCRSLYVAGSQSLTLGKHWVSCPSCCQQSALTLLSSCSTFFLVLQQPVHPSLLRALTLGHGWSESSGS